LEHYYLTEGQRDPIVLDIPRGSYNAVFQVRQDFAAAADAETPDVSPVAPLKPIRGSRLVWVLLAVIVALCVACILLSVRLWFPSNQQTPAVRMLWSNLVRPSQKTSVVVADSGFGFLQDALGVPMDLDQYLQHDPRQWVQSAHADPNLSNALEMLAFRQYTSIGDLALARRILSANAALQSQISIVFARNYNARGPTSDNVILLGSQRSNPWVQLYLEKLNFVFDYDEASRKVVVRNRSPRQGESAEYLIAGNGPGIKEGYAVMAYLPNRAHSANVLMLAGTDMEATEAVGVLATDEAELAPALAKIAGNGQLVYFEALFKTRRLAGAPQECRLVSWRQIPD
jgi:hypothetical protein